jgi:hypothetical protein
MFMRPIGLLVMVPFLALASASRSVPDKAPACVYPKGGISVFGAARLEPRQITDLSAYLASLC